jgi:hypothetical protein
MDDPRNTTWHTAARIEQKRRLDIQIFDYKHSLGHATYYEAWKTAGLVMGTIGELQGYGLLEPAEVAEYQAQVRTAFAEAQPADLELFDQLWMWDPMNPPEQTQ